MGARNLKLSHVLLLRGGLQPSEETIFMLQVAAASQSDSESLESGAPG